MTNHGCGINWCTNTDAASESQRLEHDSAMWYGSATGRPLDRRGTAFNESLLTVGVGVRFNADVDVAPSLVLHLVGGSADVDADAHLQLNEAVLLHRALGDCLRAALTGYDLKPDALVDYYSRAVDE